MAKGKSVNTCSVCGKASEELYNGVCVECLSVQATSEGEMEQDLDADGGEVGGFAVVYEGRTRIKTMQDVQNLFCKSRTNWDLAMDYWRERLGMGGVENEEEWNNTKVNVGTMLGRYGEKLNNGVYDMLMSKDFSAIGLRANSVEEYRGLTVFAEYGE